MYPTAVTERAGDNRRDWIQQPQHGDVGLTAGVEPAPARSVSL